MSALVIAAGAFEPLYLRIFAIDRVRLGASLVELPYRKLPGLRTLLVEARDRTGDGDVIAIYAPYSWDNGYEYAYARSLYVLAGRRVVTSNDVSRAQWICAYRSEPVIRGFDVVWRRREGTLLRRAPHPASGHALPAARGESLLSESAFIFLALVSGFAIALIIDRRAVGVLLVGEALLLGIASCSLVLTTVPWSRPIFVVAIGIITVAALIAALRVKRAPAELGTRYSPLGAAMNIATVVLVVGYALFATAAPLWEFDFLLDWGLKARQFFYAGGIDWQFLQGAWPGRIHPDYPPLLPLTFDAIAVLRGSWSDRYLGLVNVAFAAALLLIVYRLAVEDLRSHTGSAFITLSMVPLAATPWIGLAESAFVAYATAALLLIRKDSMAVGAVMLGLAALTKNEGSALIVAVAIALIVAGRARQLPRLWPAILIPLPWWVMRSMHHLPTDITTGNLFARMLQHAIEPDVFLALALYPLGKRLFWIGIVAGIVMALRKLDRFVVTALAAQLTFYIGAYLATPYDVGWHVQYSWERLVAHLTPSLTFVVLIALLATRPLPTTYERAPAEGSERLKYGRQE